MSHASERFASTVYGERKKPSRTPPKSQMGVKRTPKTLDVKKKESQNFQDLAIQEKDQRFRYLLKHGELKKIEKSGNIIFAELPQIPNVWVCYRRPVERQLNVDKLSLNSLELKHVPLLEGEEKLKMLTFEFNQITRIENLISLPNLLYIDFASNSIHELENLSVPTLKVLLVPKNQITRLKNLTELLRLQVLDLHGNKISRIEGVAHMTSLRILNLAQNQIPKMQNIDTLFSLTELNLKNNLIVAVECVGKLHKLQKLNLAHNRIEMKSIEQSELGKLQQLGELCLESNPCGRDRIGLLRQIMRQLPGLKTMDGKTPTMVDESGGEEEDSNHEEVLRLIAEQWEEEKRRIVQVEEGGGGKKELMKTTCVTGGHAEVEDENILYVYGNSFDVVLAKQPFQETVEKIRFEFVFIEFLIEANILTMIRRFKYVCLLRRKLKILEFRENYISSLLQIAKLENLPNLRTLIVEGAGNPVSHCTLLKEFVIYRFPVVMQINREDVKEVDRARAKTFFNVFDKVLQIPEKTSAVDSMRNYPSEEVQAKKDRNYLKSFNKITTEAAEGVVKQVMGRAHRAQRMKDRWEEEFDTLILKMIQQMSQNA